MKLILLIFVLLLFRCTDVLYPEPFKDTQSQEDLGRESDGLDGNSRQDDRPKDEVPIGGEKLGEVFVASKKNEPSQAGVPGTAGPQKNSQGQDAPRVDPPKPTHIVTVICIPTMEIIVEFGDQQAKAPLLSASNCGALVTALNAKSFPTGLTATQTTGGPTMGATCIGGSLDLEIKDSQGGLPTISTLALGDTAPCLEIRNVINNLNL